MACAGADTRQAAARRRELSLKGADRFDQLTPVTDTAVRKAAWIATVITQANP